MQEFSTQLHNENAIIAAEYLFHREKAPHPSEGGGAKCSMMNGELRNPEGGGREERDERDWRESQNGRSPA